MSKKFSKVVATGLVTTMVAGMSNIVFAQEIPLVQIQESQQVEAVITEVVEETSEAALLDAIEKANEALTMLAEADFTDYSNWESMSNLIKDALSIVGGPSLEGVEDERKQEVYKALEKINRSYNSIVARIHNAISGLKSQFDNGALEGKEIAVQQLEQIIKEEKELNYEYVNETTVNSAIKILDQYKLQLELARAVHEANMTSDMLENADFTVYGNWELMSSYIGAAVDRVNGVRYNGIEDANTQYVYDVLARVNRSYNSIVARIQHAINGLKSQMENGGLEGQQIALEQFKTIIDEEKGMDYVNKTTLDRAEEIYEEYAASINASEEIEQDDKVQDELMKELESALIEAKLTEGMLADTDFTIRGEWERMCDYIKAAVARADGLRYNGIDNEDVQHIYQVLDQVNRSYNSVVGRIQNAINGLESQFSNGSLEGKEIAVQQLEQIIKEEKELNYEYVNETTVNSATKILDQYKLHLELARAMHEANMTSDMLENADFTVYGNWELMSSYIRAAVGRVDGVRYNGIENEDTKYVYEVLDQVNRSYNSVVGRIQNAINGLKAQFENGTPEGKEIAIEQLRLIIEEESNLDYVNETTLESARKILDSYTEKVILNENKKGNSSKNGKGHGFKK